MLFDPEHQAGRDRDETKSIAHHVAAFTERCKNDRDWTLGYIAGRVEAIPASNRRAGAEMMLPGRRDSWAVGWVAGVRECAWRIMARGEADRAAPLFAGAAKVLAAVTEEAGQ